MGYSQENGYVATDIATIMSDIMSNINTQFGTSYTDETFVGTAAYKYFYALAQKYQQNEIATSEIFLKLQTYFDEINARISRPVVTNPGIIEKMESEGYVVSVKPMIEADAGKINICVDTDETADDYADTKLAICTLIKDIAVAGAVTQGSESETITLTNGQAFDFKYHLPDRIPVWLRLTITLSENNQVVIGDPDDTKVSLIENLQARYRLGKNFEPQKYFAISDAPWAAKILLEWTDDITETSPGVWEVDGGATWHDEVFNAEFDELFDYALSRTTLVEE